MPGWTQRTGSKAVKSILHELNRIKEGLPAEELHKAREFLKGRFVLRMEDSRSVASWLGAQELLNNRVQTVEQVIAEVDAVTTDDVLRVANSLLVSEKVNLAIVGPYRSDKAFQANLRI